MDEQLKIHPIHTRQHRFRTDRNTETAISEAVDYIEKHIMNNQHAIGVFLDIQAAFDTISPKKIKESLLKHGGDPIMVGWYDSYITHRNIIININGVIIELSASAGFPQGGVCSAKFWIIACDEALLMLNKRCTQNLLCRRQPGVKRRKKSTPNIEQATKNSNGA